MSVPSTGAFSLPPFPTILANIRRSTAATLAAIALSITPSSPPPTPSPIHHILPTRTRQQFATAPVVVFDKDYATRAPSIWQLQPSQPSTSTREHASLERALPHPPPLPPPPLLSAEVRILARLLVALVVGGIIGMERRAANSLAGVRTFSLVSLGAAIFMSTTLLAFPKADPTRVAAAISSGVGFLGAGAMHKDSSKHSRGLTTASSVWLAAALGIAAACGMFLLSFMGAISTVLIARYARFDSSLHLIRGDPLGDMDEGFEHGDEQFSETRLRYPEQNGFIGSRGGVYEVGSVVDFDPSSQKGYSEWRGNGSGNDGSHTGQSAGGDSEQV